MEMSNPEHFEVLCVAGKIKGVGERVVVVAVYIPPNYPRHRADMCLDYVADTISEAKSFCYDHRCWRLEPMVY